MPSNEPSTNGGVPDKPSELQDFLEAVDPAELRIDDIPTVEAAAPPPAEQDGSTVEVAVVGPSKQGSRDAVVWFLVSAGLFLGTVYAAAAINRSNAERTQKIYQLVGLFVGTGIFALILAIFSALQRGFTYGKACLRCVLFLIVSQVPPTLIVLGGIFVALASAKGTQKLTTNDEIAEFVTNWENSPVGHIVWQIAILFGQVLIIYFSFFMLRWVIGPGWKRRIAFRPPRLEHVILAAIAMPALLVISIALEIVISRAVPSWGGPDVGVFIKDQVSNWPWGIALLAVAIGPAIGEELWCRGFLGQGLGRQYGNFGSVLLTSTLFALIHAEPRQVVGVFFIALALHLSYLASRSILVPMLMHFINNSIGVLAESKTGALPVAQSLEVSFNHRPELFLCVSIILLITVGLIMYSSRVRIVTPAGTEAPSAMYPHVELPSAVSPNQPAAGYMPAAAVGALIIASCLFAAVWYGL